MKEGQLSRTDINIVKCVIDNYIITPHSLFLLPEVHRLTEMRILLLGHKASGKSSSTRTILGGEEPNTKTSQCLRSRGEVGGVMVTVTEAPGWWSNYMVKDTPNLNAEEVVLGVSPGPHAVLLVVRLDTPFTGTSRRAVEQRLLLFRSEDVWRHSMVLFTFGDHLGERPIEKHMEGEGEALRWLIEKCGNRVHVLNNKDRKDSRQVEELLGKIKGVMMENSGCAFEADCLFLRFLKAKRRSDELKAAERLMEHKQAFECQAGKVKSVRRSSVG